MMPLCISIEPQTFGSEGLRSTTVLLSICLTESFRQVLNLSRKFTVFQLAICIEYTVGVYVRYTTYILQKDLQIILTI